MCRDTRSSRESGSEGACPLKFVPTEVLHNLLMGLQPVAKFAQRFHSTGLNADSVRANRVFDLYSRFVSVQGKDILEIGPGHTLEVLERARTEGARSCTAIDVVDYRLPKQAKERSITCVVYGGREVPFECDRFDVIWSYTAFEHLRYPALSVKECFRILRPGGCLVAFIDLGDHSFYGKATAGPDVLFDCLRYPEWLWNLMRWNRSSYVNRLRRSDWLRLFAQAGFVLRAQEATVSEDIARLLPELAYLQKYSYDDAVTSILTVCVEKPRASPGSHSR
jgi:SAM-dependent methyltransferase